MDTIEVSPEINSGSDELDTEHGNLTVFVGLESFLHAVH